MDPELTALAASGATTLVSLMVTDSWARARALLGRFSSRAGSASSPLPDLEEARSRLLVTVGSLDDEPRASVTAACQAHLQHCASRASPAELRALVDALLRLESDATPRPSAVHNKIEGGVHHAPIIQSGHIAGLTLHVSQSSPGQDK